MLVGNADPCDFLHDCTCRFKGFFLHEVNALFLALLFGLLIFIGVFGTFGLHLPLSDSFPVYFSAGLFPVALPTRIVPHVCDIIDEITGLVIARFLDHTLKLFAFVLSSCITSVTRVLLVILLSLIAEFFEDTGKLSTQLLCSQPLLQRITDKIVQRREPRWVVVNHQSRVSRDPVVIAEIILSRCYHSTEASKFAFLRSVLLHVLFVSVRILFLTFPISVGIGQPLGPLTTKVITVGVLLRLSGWVLNDWLFVWLHLPQIFFDQSVYRCLALFNRRILATEAFCVLPIQNVLSSVHVDEHV